MAKKMTRILTALFALMFVCSMVMMASAATIKFNAEPKAADDDENNWWVGANLTVTPGSGGAFTMASKNGQPAGANIGWGFTVEQLKKTPNFHINIKNSGAADGGPYMRTFFSNPGKPDQTNPDFLNPDLENWVRANTKNGDHSFNLLEALGSNLPTDDEALIVLMLYIDPVDSGEALSIGSIYLSGEVSDPVETGDTTAGGNNATAAATTKAGSSPDTGVVSTEGFLILVASLAVVGVVAVVGQVAKKKAR